MRSKFPVMETDKEWSIENDGKTAQGSSSEFQKPSLPHFFFIQGGDPPVSDGTLAYKNHSKYGYIYHEP